MQIPAQWQEVLEKVQVHFPQAVIAGGALRDLWHEKPIKDVDIFIEVTDVEDNLYVDQMADLDPYFTLIKASVYGQQSLTDTKGFRHIHAIYRITDRDIIYELIFIQKTSVPAYMEFDINICQAQFDGKNVDLTPAFLEGVGSKTLRVMNVNRKDRQTKRLERVATKFPEYTVEYPSAEEN